MPTTTSKNNDSSRQPSASTSQQRANENNSDNNQQQNLDPALFSTKQFQKRGDLSSPFKRSLEEVLHLDFMTDIQERSFATILNGTSVVGRAPTGTGKTLAYLLPSLERLEQDYSTETDRFTSVGVLIVVPTRELAQQIALQAEALLTFHRGNDVQVACIYGGTKMIRDIRMLAQPRLPTVLVATPGRLLDHLEDDTRIDQRRRFRAVVQETNILVLDEADQLLEGFARETKRIMSFLPRSEKRQTLLYSATISNKLKGFLKGSMKLDFEEIYGSGTEEQLMLKPSFGSSGNKDEQQQVLQSCLTLTSMQDYMPILLTLLRQTIQEHPKDYKILVFFPASKLVRFTASILGMLGSKDVPPILEIHSRMSQASRRRASESFRSSSRAILFSSDVSARGMDYPNVSLVIQYGAPSTGAAYLHRVGRTGRAGQKGEGILVLMPFESKEKVLKKTPVKRQVVEHASVDEIFEKAQSADHELESIRRQVRSGHKVLTPNAEAAYLAFLAYYGGDIGKSTRDTLSAGTLLSYATEFASSSGLADLPPVESKMTERLGLKGLVEEQQ